MSIDLAVPVYDDTVTHVTVLHAYGVEPTRPVVPVEAESLRRITEAGREADDAYGEPCFHALARRFVLLVQEHRAIYGIDPRPVEPEPLTVGQLDLSCGHRVHADLSTPDCTPECWQ